MFRNVALTGILALGAMLAGCGESPQPTPPAAGEGASAPSAVLPGDAKSESTTPAAPGATARSGSLAEVSPGLARRDTNGDDKISRDEFLAQSKARLTRLDKNKDGALEAAEMPKGTKPKSFATLDKDKNGKVTLAELSAAAEANFTKLDKNKDGFITADEGPAPKAKK